MKLRSLVLPLAFLVVGFACVSVPSQAFAKPQLDYAAIDALPSNTNGYPVTSQRRAMFSDATVARFWRDRVGVYVVAARDRQLKDWASRTEWKPWLDGAGHPWLRKSISAWESLYWQAHDWRNITFRSERDFKLCFEAGHYQDLKPIDQAPRSEENWRIQGIITNPIEAGGELGNVPSDPREAIKSGAVKLPTRIAGHNHPGDCPGPYCPAPRPAPAPQPRPTPTPTPTPRPEPFNPFGPLAPLLPPIQPRIDVPIWVWCVVGGVAFLLITGGLLIFLIVLIWVFKRLFKK